MQIKLSYVVVVVAYIAHNTIGITPPNLTKITNQRVSLQSINIIDVPSPVGLIRSVETNAPLVAAEASHTDDVLCHHFR